LLYICAGLAIIGVAALWLGVRASLPQLDGEHVLSGLAAPVRITRDEIGVASVLATSRQDAALATGFVHAQERFFQMDLMRRLAAGELAELVGEAAIGHDLRQRVHRMRSVARRVVDAASASERAIVAAYTRGVNAGLRALAARPFEYLILRAQPAAWLAEDTVLVVLAMYFRLHDEHGERESRLARLRDALPPVMYAFLTQAGTNWDAPLVGDALPALPVPGVEVCDVRRVERNPLALDADSTARDHLEAPVVGSNVWAVSPQRTRDRVALLANDMHMGLAVPNTWFRLRLRVEEASGTGFPVDVTGVTLPGTPAVVVGSNGNVAWGFANTYGDWVDLVELEMDPRDPERYRTPDGFQPFQEHRETIRIHGGPTRSLLVRSTVWGPVIGRDAKGVPRALRWLAHDAEATNLKLLDMERARNVHEAIEVAHRSGIPPQNLIAADSAGNIAWTVMGRIPRREGYDPRLPSSWAAGGRGWHGWLPPAEYPRLINPAAGALWSANARVVDGSALAILGDGGYALGSRATQIRDNLLGLQQAKEADMLAIQLDDRALFLARWRKLLLQTLGDDVEYAELRRTVEAGAHRAAVDDAGYRLVRAFRREVAARVWSTILVGCGGLYAGEDLPAPRQWEGALWRVLDARPMHLLNPRYESWRELLLAGAGRAAAACGRRDLDRCTWGDANVARIRHPLGRALPLLADWLDMPPTPLPGDTHMPRVQRPQMGASERFAVSPGREEHGYFHMPVGQSAHPMSPFYAAGHRAWEQGEATPFLPGPARHRLTLTPDG
jgi:penicillin amidase